MPKVRGQWIVLGIVLFLGSGCAENTIDVEEPLEISSTIFHIGDTRVAVGTTSEAGSLVATLASEDVQDLSATLEEQFAQSVVASVYDEKGSLDAALFPGAYPGSTLKGVFENVAQALIQPAIEEVDLLELEDNLTAISVSDEPEAITQGQELLSLFQEHLTQIILTNLASQTDQLNEREDDQVIEFSIGDLRFSFISNRQGDVDTIELNGEPLMFVTYDVNHQIIGIQDVSGNEFGILQDRSTFTGITDGFGHEVSKPGNPEGYEILGVNIGANFMIGFGIRNPVSKDRANDSDERDTQKSNPRFEYVGISAGAGINISISLSALQARDLKNLVGISVYAPISVWLGEERIDKGMTKYFGLMMAKREEDRFANTHGLSVDLTRRLPGFSLDLTKNSFAPSISKNDTASERDISYTYTTVVKTMSPGNRK